MKQKLLIDRDRLVNADRTMVARLCVLLFDRIQQHENYEEQILALAAAFLLMCEAAGLPAQDAFVAVKNLMTDPTKSEGLGLQFSAMRFHLQTELMAGAT